MRFSKTPGGADLARIQAKRMAHADLLPSEDLHATIAEICQFLSTLFVVYGLDNLDEEDRAPLLRKLRTWNEEYRGRFAEETTGRCIQMLAPEGQEGMQMEHFLMPLMRMTLTLGVEMCAIKGCPSEKDENRQLMQCGRWVLVLVVFHRIDSRELKHWNWMSDRCRTVRYVSGIR